jgi:hypothetical protein
MADFAAAASVPPSGLPWLPAVPALVGAEKPMMVRQASSTGRFTRIAQAMAEATAAGSCPSTRRTAQP